MNKLVVILLLTLLLVVLVTNKRVSKVDSYCLEETLSKEVVYLPMLPINDTIETEFSLEVFEPFMHDGGAFTFITNEDGFIIGKNHLNDETIKLFFLGGSTTKNLYVKSQNRFPNKVQEIIRDQCGIKINAYNCGRGSLNTYHSVNLLLNKVLKYYPDYAVLYHGVNDVFALYYFGADYFSTISPRRLNRTVKELLETCSLEQNNNPINELLYKLGVETPHTLDEFKEIRGQVDFRDIDFDRIEYSFRKMVKTFVGICNANEIIPVLMTQPTKFGEISLDLLKSIRPYVFETIDVDQHKAFFSGIQKVSKRLNEIIIEVATETGSPIIDLNAQTFEMTDFYDEVHFNDKGSLLAADYIAEVFINEIIDTTTLTTGLNKN